MNANASCGQKFTESQFQCGSMLAQVKCVTEPCRCHTSAAAPTSISSGTYVPTPPAFCSHFPIRKPIIFRYTATNSSANDPTSKNVRFSASLRCADAADVRAHRRAGHQQSGKIEKRVDPIRPAGHESVKFPERLLRPGVEPALLRKAAGKLDDHQRRRHKK